MRLWGWLEPPISSSPPKTPKGPQQGPRRVMGRRSGHGASCSLGSTDIFCQTEGKQQPKLGEISSPRARLPARHASPQPCTGSPKTGK